MGDERNEETKRGTQRGRTGVGWILKESEKGDKRRRGKRKMRLVSF